MCIRDRLTMLPYSDLWCSLQKTKASSGMTKIVLQMLSKYIIWHSDTAWITKSTKLICQICFSGVQFVASFDFIVLADYTSDCYWLKCCFYYTTYDGSCFNNYKEMKFVINYSTWLPINAVKYNFILKSDKMSSTGHLK